MKASCSVWSADLLRLQGALDLLGKHTDEFHVDVMDGNVVPDILFGVDFVRAMRAATEIPIDVHLMTRTTFEWIERCVEAGAARLAIHAEWCEDIGSALERIKSLGSLPVLVLPLHLPIEEDALPWGAFQRVLLMGTEIGIKGVGLDTRIFGRIEALARFRVKLGLTFEIFVDGGIRRETVPQLAAAGADGVVPGSLVFGAEDPIAMLAWIHSLPGADSKGSASTASR